MTSRAPVATVTAMAVATPPSREQEDLWDGYFAAHFGGSRWAHRLFAGAGVTRRHPAVDPTAEDLSQASTAARMARYQIEAMPLGKSAVAAALDGAGLAPGDIGLFTVVSCTGYGTPGVDIHLARDLAMGAGTQRLFVGHMGCFAALPALGAVADHVVARGRPSVLLCLELASLHLQPAGPDLEQVVTHALFSDAAAAVVVEPGTAPGAGTLAVVDTMARTDAATADHMTWEVTDLGFRMGLSRRVPDVLARHVGGLVDDLLAANGVAVGEVSRWVVHPGGPQILDVVAERLGLADDALDESRRVLAEHGNCSSATVLLVLDEVRRHRPPPVGSYVVLLAFGPGLTLYATLLQA